MFVAILTFKLLKNDFHRIIASRGSFGKRIGMDVIIVVRVF